MREGLMEQGVIMDVARGAMMTVLYLALPMLGISLIVGLAISVFQATTSIQEQTLTFIPKLITILLSLVLFGAWMGKMMVEYTVSLYERVLQIIK
jgi:flagellar biosynthetic protein FliQ